MQQYSLDYFLSTNLSKINLTLLHVNTGQYFKSHYTCVCISAWELVSWDDCIHCRNFPSFPPSSILAEELSLNWVTATQYYISEDVSLLALFGNDKVAHFWNCPLNTILWKKVEKFGTGDTLSDLFLYTIIDAFRPGSSRCNEGQGHTRFLCTQAWSFPVKLHHS